MNIYVVTVSTVVEFERNSEIIKAFKGNEKDYD
jgi:hypothetical protein